MLTTAEMTNKWVSALTDDSAGITTFASCISLTDMYGDGDTKLVLAHIGSSKFNMRLKVYKGVSVIAESALADVPTAVVSFNNEKVFSFSLPIEKENWMNLRTEKVKKYSTPSAPIHIVEQEAWSKAAQQELTHEELFTIIKGLGNEISPKKLTPLSQSLLLTKEEDRDSFINHYLAPKYINNMYNPATITCLTSMRKTASDFIDVLIFGTERCAVRVVDTQAFKIIADCQLPGVPVHLVPHGVFDVDYRIFVSTREGEIFSIKRDQTKKERPIITCKTHIVSIAKVNKMLAVACSDYSLSFYSFNGKCLTSISIERPIRGLELFHYAPKQFSGLLVLLDNQIRLYTHLHLLDIIKLDRSLSWIKFGQYGREEGALIIGTQDGGLIVKLFRRKALLDEKIDLNPHPHAYNIKLNIPKKTKVFIDQTVREREHAVQINQTYQRDLFLIRHHTTSAFAHLSTTATDTVSTDPNEPVDITVDVNGFGPTFRLTVKLSCSSKTPLYNMWLSIVFNPSLYQFDTTLIPISILMPGHFYTFTTLVECLAPEKGISEDIRVLLIRDDRPTPIVTAIVTMPISEVSLLD